MKPLTTRQKEAQRKIYAKLTVSQLYDGLIQAIRNQEQQRDAADRGLADQLDFAVESLQTEFVKRLAKAGLFANDQRQPGSDHSAAPLHTRADSG